MGRCVLRTRVKSCHAAGRTPSPVNASLQSRTARPNDPLGVWHAGGRATNEGCGATAAGRRRELRSLRQAQQRRGSRTQQRRLPPHPISWRVLLHSCPMGPRSHEKEKKTRQALRDVTRLSRPPGEMRACHTPEYPTRRYRERARADMSRCYMGSKQNAPKDARDPR